MKFLDEYRDAESARGLADAIARITTREWTLMEVCGGQTHSIIRFGIDSLLPDEITLVHGPGCPVCVTPIESIDRALDIASRRGVIFCSFGDMLRVPGSEQDLLSVKANGGDVRAVYSPLDALEVADANPDKEVVFFAVGFETTAPANAMAVHQAKMRGLINFSVLVSHVLVPPAIESILSSPENKIQGFLAAGHVCTVMGLREYVPISERYGVPIVVTGFEPVDILRGIYECVHQLEEGRAEVENAYGRAVREDGNQVAMDLIGRVFAVIDRKWRGLGEIESSGLGLAAEYAEFDADQRFSGSGKVVEEPKECLSGLVLQGLLKPVDCPAFGTKCTPDTPLGATMVSSEGACAAYYRYRGAGSSLEARGAHEAHEAHKAHKA
ncbi:MAG: hydrogenase formation protein HypD [Myxococcota bacterium]